MANSLVRHTTNLVLSELGEKRPIFDVVSDLVEGDPAVNSDRHRRHGPLCILIEHIKVESLSVHHIVRVAACTDILIIMIKSTHIFGDLS
jgi:hypothetical protein